MTAITHQRADNIREITRLALAIYDGKTEEQRRKMFENYASHIARHSTVSEQREWISILEASAPKEGKK
jgi:hypothetical protein